MQTPRSDQDPDTTLESRQQALVETLRASEELFRTAFHYSPVGMCITTLDGRLQNVNQTLLDMLGFTKAELEEKHFNDITHPEDLEIGRDVVGRMISGAVPSVSFEKRYLRKTGEVVWTQVNSTLLRDASGKPRHFITQILDITERRQVEEQLREGEEKYRAFFLNSMDAILLTSPDGTVQSANPAACKMLGRTEAEICALGRSGLVDMNDPRLIPLLEERARTGKSVGELTMFRQDGSPFPVEMSSALFQNSQGNTRTSMIIRDISERKQAEKDLRENEQKFSLLFKRTPFAAGLAKFPAGNIVEVNEEFEKLVGYSREEIIGKTSFELEMYPDPETRARMFAEFQERGFTRNAELEFRTRFGDLHHLLISTDFIEIGQEKHILTTIQDVTQRKQAEASLRESEARYHHILDTMMEGCQIIGFDWRYLYVNEIAAAQQAQLKPEEMLNRTVMELYPGVEDTELFAVLRRCMEGRVPAHVETEFVFPDGRRVWFELSIQPTLDGIFILSTDITEHKQAEELLKQQAETLREQAELLDNAHVLIRDADNRITYWNNGAEKLYGWSKAEALGQVSHALLQTQFPESQEATQSSLFGKGVWEGELMHVRRDGERVYIASHQVVQRNADGQILAILEVNNDITERKQAEEKIERQNQRLSVLREIDTAILSADSVEDIVGAALDHIRELIDCRRANLTLIDRETNEAVMFGVRAAGETSIPAGRRLPLAALGDIIQTLSQNQPILFSDLRALPDPGPGIQALLQEGLRSTCSLPLFSQGSLIGMFSMHSENAGFFDEEKISLGREVANQVAIALTQSNLLNELRDLNADLEQRVAMRTEELHQLNIELQNAIHTRDEFLAGMSHELRTPLNAIIGFTGTLLMKLPGPLNANQEKQLTTIQTSARHLLSLINDLLDLARIAAGKVKLNLESVVCQGVIEEVVTTLRPLVEAKGLHFQVESPKDEIILQTDRRALHQIILNLSNNAIKFTEHGEIRLELAQRSQNGRSAVEISVADTGIGIRAEAQVKLFEAFEQVGSSGSHRSEGTGLGLHLSQKLAGLLGGQISFVSEYGKGSTFTLVLPER